MDALGRQCGQHTRYGYTVAWLLNTREAFDSYDHQSLNEVIRQQLRDSSGRGLRYFENAVINTSSHLRGNPSLLLTFFGTTNTPEFAATPPQLLELQQWRLSVSMPAISTSEVNDKNQVHPGLLYSLALPAFKLPAPDKEHKFTEKRQYVVSIKFSGRLPNSGDSRNDAQTVGDIAELTNFALRIVRATYAANKSALEDSSADRLGHDLLHHATDVSHILDIKTARVSLNKHLERAVRVTVRREDHLAPKVVHAPEVVQAPEVVRGPEIVDASDTVHAPAGQPVQCFVALGSNVGERFSMIEKACKEMSGEEGIALVRTSGLYETQPMYVKDQAEFLNGVAEVRNADRECSLCVGVLTREKIHTTLKPLELLDRLQAIENRLGRVKTIDKGPRNIDLDILLYGEEKFSSDRLTIPHSLMHEREFVLRPLSV